MAWDQTITPKVEFEFASGVWTDMTSLGYVDGQSNVRWKRGVGPNRVAFTSTCSLSIDNADEAFTPGNTSSTYFNKLLRGIGIRVSSTHSATTRYHFRGIISDIKPVFPGLPGSMRVAISAKGISANLKRQKRYKMGLSQDIDVDDAADAMMEAAGWTGLYDFEDSAVVVPLVAPLSDPLTDLTGLWQSDPSKLLFEAGDGKLKAVSVVGGHSSPDHTWGTTIVPDGDLQPDYRYESQYSRQVVTLSVLKPTEAIGAAIYTHPLTTGAGVPDFLPKDDRTMIVRGTYDEVPMLVRSKFGVSSIQFADANKTITLSITDVQTTIRISAQPQFGPRTLIRIEGEIIDVLSVQQIFTGPGTGYIYELTVVRGVQGTTAAAHAAGSQVFYAAATITYSAWATLQSGITNTATTVTVTGAPSAPGDGSYYKIDNEIIRVTSGTSTTWTVQRGVQGTSAVGHSALVLVYLQEAAYPQGPAGTRVLSTVDDEGAQPTETAGQGSTPVPGIVGAGWYQGGQDVYSDGNAFEFGITNVADDILWQTPAITGGRYVRELVITGDYVKVESKRANIVFEDPLPGDSWNEEGPVYNLPFGAPSTNHAKAIAIGLARAGRVPSPWIATPWFVANLGDNVTSMLTAEIGDLVRWTGTGTWREKIDEFYRIMGVEGMVDNEGQFRFAFSLAPAHLFRDPTKCWFEDFTRLSKPYTIGFLPELPPVFGDGLGTWLDPGADWGTGVALNQTYSGPSVRRTNTYAYALGAAASLPALVNINSADMVVGTKCFEPTASALTYPTPGGGGPVFRSNSGGTNYWWATANRTAGKIQLWNTTDGVVADYTYTVAKGVQPEIEVRAMGNLIRVYVDCLPEPVITVTSTRFNSNTHGGFRVVANSIPNHSYEVRQFYGQAL